MSKYIIDGVQMTSLADAVRTATGTSDPLSFGEIISTVGTMGTGTDYLASVCNRTITSLNNSEIEQVPEGMFKTCYDLSYVNLPNASIIEGAAFYSCWSLMSISLENCKSINTNAFTQCTILEDIYLPNCSYLANEAFWSVNNISNFYAPKLEYIGGNALCTNINTNFIVSDYCNASSNYQATYISDSTTRSAFMSIKGTFNSKTMITNDGWASVFSEANTWYDSATGIITFPESIGYLTGRTLWDTNSLTYSSCSGISGSGITTIHSSMFGALNNLMYLNCPNLVNIFFSSRYAGRIFSTFIVGDLISCGSYGLYYAPSTATIPNLTRCRYFGQSAVQRSYFSFSVNLDECSYIGNYAFTNCYNISFYGNLKKCSNVGQTAFRNCTLEKIDSPTLTYIGGNAFWECKSLSYLNAPNIGLIYYGAFSSCEGLLEVNLSTVKTLDSNCFLGCLSLQSVYAPQCTTLKGNVFGNCSILSNLTLDWNNLDMTYGGGGNFYNCPSLYDTHDSLVFVSANGNSEYILVSNLYSRNTLTTINCVYIDGNPFKNPNKRCYYVSMPYLKYVPYSTFQNYQSLYSFYADVCSSVYGGAFSWCQQLKTISLPNCLSLDNGVFSSCSALSNVYLPKVKYIREYAFCYCKSLSTIDLPECTNLYGYAFTYCTSLTDISIPKVKTIETCCFDGCTKLSIFNFDNIEVVNAQAFQSCAFRTISIPNLTSMPTPNYLFNNCIYLSEVYIGFSTYSHSSNTYLSIGRQMFGYCSNFATLSLSLNGRDLRAIGSAAFIYCSTALQKISFVFGYSDLLSNINHTIGSQAFQGCSILSKILFSDNKNSLYNNDQFMPNVFAACSNLMSVYLLMNMDTSYTISKIWTINNSNVFTGTPMVDSSYTGSFGSIYVQSSYLSLYQANNVWSWFSDRLVGLTDQEIENVIANW